MPALATRTLALILLALVASCAGVAMAQAPADERAALEQEVLLALSTYEGPRDVDAYWQRFPVEAVDVLAGIASDDERAGFLRARALTALGCFDDPMAMRVLAHVALDATAGARRATAALALARQGRAGAFDVLDSMTIAELDGERDARMAAIDALGALADARALARLDELVAENQLERERLAQAAAVDLEQAQALDELETEALMLHRARAAWLDRDLRARAGNDDPEALAASRVEVSARLRPGEMRGESLLVDVVAMVRDAAPACEVRLLDAGGFTPGSLALAGERPAVVAPGTPEDPQRVSWTLERRGAATHVWFALEVRAVGGDDPVRQVLVEHEFRRRR